MSDNAFKIQGPDSFLMSPKAITSVPVQTSDLHRLKNHIEEIQIPEAGIEWNGILIGAAITCLITLSYEWYQSKVFPIVYGVFAFILIVSAYIYSQYQINTSDFKKSFYKAEEAKKDISEIFSKANLDTQSSKSDNS